MISGSVTESKSGSSQSPVVIYLDENGNECSAPRVRKVIGAHARHVTVTSYSRRHKETHKHTSHHVTTVRWALEVYKENTQLIIFFSKKYFKSIFWTMDSNISVSSKDSIDPFPETTHTLLTPWAIKATTASSRAIKVLATFNQHTPPNSIIKCTHIMSQSPHLSNLTAKRLKLIQYDMDRTRSYQREREIRATSCRKTS